jgi:hypothetical protein
MPKQCQKNTNALHLCLVFIIPLRLLTLDRHQFCLPLIIHHQRRQMPPTRTPRIQSLRILMDIQPPLPVMPVYHRRALMLLEFLLLMIPKLFPWRAVMFRARHAGAQVDRAHVHNMHGVLFFKRCIGHEAGVHGDEVAEVGDVADAQDDRALLKEYEIFAGELLCELEEFLLSFRVRGRFDEVEGWIVGGEVGGGNLLGVGDGEEEFVFPVAADAGGAELADHFDDARGVRAWR